MPFDAKESAPIDPSLIEAARRSPPTSVSTPDEPQGDPAAASPALTASAFHIVRDVEVEVTLEIGRKRMRIADVLRISPGQTVGLDKSAGEPLDIYVNGRLLGRGEAVILGDRYGVRITEIEGDLL